MSVSFKCNGATITLENPNTGSRMKLNFLRNLAIEIGNGEEFREYIASECAYMLYPIVSVDGDPGFPIPYNNPTKQAFQAFVDDVRKQDESVFVDWINALNNMRTVTQSDPDLLPEHELNDDQKKASASKKSA